MIHVPITPCTRTTTALPSAFRRLIITCDGAGASLDLIARLDELADWSAYQLIYTVGWERGGREKAAIAAVLAMADRGRCLRRGPRAPR